MKSDQATYKLWDEFLEQWPLARLERMTLQEYSRVGDQSSFTYAMEARLADMGSIWGGSSFKFGIFHRKDKSPMESGEGLIFTDNYAWYEKYGKTENEAFENVRSIVVRVARAASVGDLNSIEAADLGRAYKWKIAFHYQDRQKPVIVGVFKRENLLAFLRDDASAGKATMADLYRQVLARRGNTPILEFGATVWNESEKRLDEQRFLPQSAEALLVERYGFRVEPTKKISAFETDAGLQLALDREGKSTRLFLADYGGGLDGVALKKRYTPNENRNSNLSSQAPALDDGNPAVLVEVSHRQALEQLCDWYEGYNASQTATPVNEISDQKRTVMNPLNMILYGPPGTGKTYNTVDLALKILDQEFLEANADNRAALHQRFEELREANRLALVTFHQSFSYEDFMEGLVAKSDDETKQISYTVEDGVFKRICDTASSRVTTESTDAVNLAGKRIWKMSLGNTLTDDESIYEECIKNGYALLGWGGDIDFSGCTTRQEVQKRLKEHNEDSKEHDYQVTAIHTYVNDIKIGDLVIISDGNLKFRAIGQFTGDYYLLPNKNREEYRQCRSVKWLKVFTPSQPRELLFQKNLMQKTLYEVGDHNIRRDALNEMLKPEEGNSDNKPYVLIIDEINRGNIASIFGELITLIEPSKRIGNEEALTAILPYSKKRFGVPKNLYVIGTMNTADRSLANIDIALRRRFVFQEMPPRPDLLQNRVVQGVQLDRLLDVMNKRIEWLYDRDHAIGHTYFLPLDNDASMEELGQIFDNRIIPLLEEYFFEDWQRIRWVLNDHKKSDIALQFIQERQVDADGLFGDVLDVMRDKTLYVRNRDALGNPEAYRAIYE